MAGNSRRGSSFLKNAYLLLYNGGQTLGWSYLLYQLVTFYTSKDTSKLSLYETVWWTLMVFQNAAVLEIFHAIVGIVPSNVFITFSQVFSRVFVVCGILEVTKSAPISFGLPLALLAWSITEIIRYGYYTLNILGYVPYFLLYLRYTLFIVLYPIGITGELTCLFFAQQEVGENGMWTMTLPNRFNFIFNYQYVIIIIMLSYIPFFPMLYGHMFKQRKKILGGGAPTTAQKQTKKNK